MSEGDLNPETGEIPLIMNLNSKLVRNPRIGDFMRAMVAGVPGLALTRRRRLTVYQGAAGPAVSQAKPGTYLLGALWPGNGYRACRIGPISHHDAGRRWSRYAVGPAHSSGWGIRRCGRRPWLLFRCLRRCGSGGSAYSGQGASGGIAAESVSVLSTQEGSRWPTPSNGPASSSWA